MSHDVQAPASDAAPSTDDAEPLKLTEAALSLLSLAPTMKRESYAFSIDEYRNKYHSTDGPLPCFPPPPASLPKYKGSQTMPSSHSTPFVSALAGDLPRGCPSCAEEAIATYLVGGASSSPPNVDVDFQSVECSSNGEARRVLASADRDGKRFWAAIHVPGIEHPPWWPRNATPVPGFEHLIVGAHDAGIGMHRDRYCGDDTERLVSTYLALGRGRKHVILLPPGDASAQLAERLGGEGCDGAYGRQESQRAKLPARPSPDLLEAVIAAGGYWFDLEAAHEEEEEANDASEAAAPAVAEEAVDVGDEDEDDEEEEPTPMALFIPSGWWHWLVGDSPWHVAWSGSIFPGSGSGAGKGERRTENGGGRGGGRPKGRRK